MAVLRKPARAVPPGGKGLPGQRAAQKRPAGLEETSPPWDQGKIVDLHTLALDVLNPGLSLVVTEADYFGAIVQVAGTIQKVETTREATFIYMTLTGTDHEGVLKAHGGQMGQEFKLHICPPGCGRHESGDLFLHAMKGRKRRPEGEPGWISCLVAGQLEQPEDELQLLRQREQELNKQRMQDQIKTDKKKRKRSRSDQEESDKGDKKKKKKEKKKKEKDNAEETVNGRHPARAVQKELHQLFGGTALDPKERVRRRVLRQAKKLVAKKKAKQSSSSGSGGSSSSSTSSEVEATGSDGVFTEETKAKMLADRCPGSLAMETLLTMRQSLLTTSGEEGPEQSTKPLALLYYRNVLARRATGAQSRELLNLATAIDALLKGKPAATLDILCQRLKAQEAVLNGTSWAVAQKIELAPSDIATLVARGELQSAQRETYLDARARWQTQSTTPAKGAPKGKGKGKSDREGAAREERREEGRKDKGKGQDKK